MPRIAGIDVPKNKRIDIALTSIFGIGRRIATNICTETGIDPATRAFNLGPEEVAKLRKVIDEKYMVEGDLRKEVSGNIKRLIAIGSYRGLRHRHGLPVRGQRTSTNARTRKGPRKAIAGKKSAPRK